MKYTILIFIFLVAFYLDAFGSRVLIKYSSQDCFVCNMKLQELLHNKNNIEYEFVLRKFSESDGGGNDFKKALAKTQAKIKYSDSIYYMYDSSNRSIVYVLEQGVVVYKTYLKDLNTDSLVAKYSQCENGNIDMPNLVKLKLFSENIYMLGYGDSYIIRVDKNRPTIVKDTIRINIINARNKMYKAKFEENNKIMIDSFNYFSKNANIDLKFSIKDFFVENDTLLILATTNYVVSTNGGSNLRIKNIAAVLKVYKSKILSCIILNFHASYFNKNNAEKSAYKIQPATFFKYKGKGFVQIQKDSISANNEMVAVVSEKANNLIVNEILNYELPKEFTKVGVGYIISDILAKDGVISNIYSTDFFNINQNTKFTVGISHNENIINLQDFNDMNFKLNFKICDFFVHEQILSILYMNLNKLYSADYDLRKGHVLNTRIIANQYPNQNFTRAILYNTDGIYSYQYMNKKIVKFSM